MASLYIEDLEFAIAIKIKRELEEKYGVKVTIRADTTEG
jgi:hypothetical protein